MSKISQLNKLISVMAVKAFADTTVATQQGATNGGTRFTDGVRLVYSREIEFKALPLMRFTQFATQKTELGVEPGLTISMLTYDNLKLGGALEEMKNMNKLLFKNTVMLYQTVSY